MPRRLVRKQILRHARASKVTRAVKTGPPRTSDGSRESSRNWFHAKVIGCPLPKQPVAICRLVPTLVHANVDLDDIEIGTINGRAAHADNETTTEFEKWNCRVIEKTLTRIKQN